MRTIVVVGGGYAGSDTAWKPAKGLPRNIVAVLRGRTPEQYVYRGVVIEGLPARGEPPSRTVARREPARSA